MTIRTQKTSRLLNLLAPYLTMLCVLALCACAEHPARKIDGMTGPGNQIPTRVQNFAPGVGTIADSQNDSPSASPRDGAVTPDSLVNENPSAARLHSLAGYLLVFYKANDRLPDQLSDLKAIAGDAADLELNAPDGQPYAYNPTGLWADGDDNRCIVAYEASEDAAGNHWCLILARPQAGKPLRADVAPLDRATFQAFRPGN